MPARLTRHRPLILLASIALPAALSACTCTGNTQRPDPPAQAPARVNHVVFCSLKDPADTREFIQESREALSQIPGVVSLFCGPHVDAGRPTVETDYDACIYVGFATLEDYNAYVAHPRHTGLVADWRDRLNWLRIYDVEDSTFSPRRHADRAR